MYSSPRSTEKLKLIYKQMIKNDHDLLNSIFDATGYLSGIIARYTSIAIDYRDRKFNDSERLEDAIIEVYVAILNYSAAVADAQNVNFAGRSFSLYLDWSLY